MARIHKDEVGHVARLARLTFSQEELEGLTNQLNDILTYIGKLEELDTAEIEPTTHALKLTNYFRRDEKGRSLSVDEALSNAPQRENGAFVVPRII